MKIAYVGASDKLANTLIERMSQEGNDVYFLAEKDFSDQEKPTLPYRYYPISQNDDRLNDVFRSASPDCIVYGGTYIKDDDPAAASERDAQLLQRVLRATELLPQVTFALVSSTQVYGNTEGAATERAERAAVTERGKHFVVLEQLLLGAEERQGFRAITLRASQMYTDTPREGDGGFLSQEFARAIKPSRQGFRQDVVYQPLHMADFADAVKRVIEAGTHPVYNVSGSNTLTARMLYQLITEEEDLPARPLVWSSPEVVTVADSSLLKQELGWTDFRSLEKQLEEGEIHYERLPNQNKKGRFAAVGRAIRQVLENLVIFAAFCAITVFSGEHEAFAQINWLLIYVIVIAIGYNLYQSVLAAVLASVAYLLYSSVTNGTPDFAFSAAHILVVLEYVFLGLLVSYTVNSAKEHSRAARSELDSLQEEYKDLEAINEENVFIKNEYEDRLLVSKTGLPRLYGLVSKLMTQEPDRILMEIVNVVGDLVNTNTVAVYRGKADNPYFRLVHALNDESTMGGG